VISVTLLQERPTMEITRMPVRSRPAEWLMGIAGLLAAAAGAWMYFVPATWFLGGLAEDWYLGLATGAGVLLAAAFGLLARNVVQDEHGWPARAVLATSVAVAAFAGAVVFALILLF
jgi:hypothetical protein